MTDQIEYTVVGPDGVEYTFTNIRGFCRAQGLDNSNLLQVLTGSRRHHKHFTCPDAGYVRRYVRVN